METHHYSEDGKEKKREVLYLPLFATKHKT